MHNSLLMPIKLMKLNILFYSILHSSNRTFWIWEVWKPYNRIWKNSKHVHCKTSLIKTRSIPLTRMILLQGKLHGALSFWRGILLQPGVGVEGLPLSSHPGLAALELGWWSLWKPGLSRRSSFTKASTDTMHRGWWLLPTFHVVLDSSCLIRLDLDMLC